jgi:D-lactate dehydrogenase
MPPLLCILTHQRQIWNDQANRQLSLKQRGLDLGNRLNQLRPVVPDIPNLLVHRPKPQHVICGRPEQRGWIVLVLTQPQWPILPLYDYPPPFLDWLWCNLHFLTESATKHVNEINDPTVARNPRNRYLHRSLCKRAGQAERLGIAVAHVPAYSPHAVAEFTIGLLLSLVRGIHRAYQRTRDGNFALEGLLGFDLHGRTAGVIGTGKIGALVARTLAAGFGCRVLAYDLHHDASLEALGITYADPRTLLAESDLISLHCPLTPETHHIVRTETLAVAKPGLVLVNTSRGALIDAKAAIEALKTGRLGGLALDVYEQEADFFFEDLSNEILTDDLLARLLTFPNVLVTGHQAFFTRDALQAIAEVTLGSATHIESGRPSGASEVKAPRLS